MTPDELDAVATFYPFIFRRPVGRHVIFVCDTVSCWVMGYETMLDHLTRAPGDRDGGDDAGRPVHAAARACLGACDHAPAMMIDGTPWRPDPEKIDTILEQYTIERSPWNVLSPSDISPDGRAARHRRIRGAGGYQALRRRFAT